MKRVLLGCIVAAWVAICPKYQARPGQEKLRSDAPAVPIHKTEVGVASWYGPDFQGSETASGERFDMKKLTAAHPRLPLGTRIKVTNLRNLRSIVVRVNDRGPHVAGRLLDVSWAAAQRLGFQRAGKTVVRIRVVSYPRRYIARGIKASRLSSDCVRPVA
jgi:rare lipoprotein A